VQAACRLDQKHLGQMLADGGEADVKADELIARHCDSRDWFYVGRPGRGNTGHDDWPVVRTDEDRRALIEYLKTL
jgi:hypothetical protein